MLEIACAAADDPFTKVRGLIADLISKLVNEANEDASQKAFCDEAMAKSKKDQSDKSMMADKLQSRIAKATATKLRTEEHANNRQAYKDYKEAGKAVEAAIAELKSYYKSLSLVQKSARTAAVGSRRQPEFGDAKADVGHSVISILENSLREYSRMAVEILASEKDAEDSFKAMMEESKVSKAAKQAEIRAAQSEIRSLAVSMDASGDDYKMVGQELDASGDDYKMV